MAFKKTNLNDIHRGDTKVFKFTFDDGAATPVPLDITGWTIWLTLKANLTDADCVAPLQIETTAGDDPNDDPVNGVMFLTITSVDSYNIHPQNYNYDFQRIIEGSSPLDVRTLAAGKVKILEDVTRSIARITTPEQFTFTDLENVQVSTEKISNAIIVSGINFPSAITIAGDATSEYSINGGEYTNVPGTVDCTDSVTVKHTASALPATAVDSILTIGGVSDTFTTTTS